MMTSLSCQVTTPPARPVRARGFFAGRVLRLEAPAPDGVVRFLTSLTSLPDSSKRETWVTITRTGKFFDRRYGDFEITAVMLAEMVANFNAKTYGQDIFIDISHQPDRGAAGQVKELQVDGGKLRALVAWTDFGIAEIQTKGFKYLSAEFADNFVDNEHKKQHGTLLIGAALTIRPVIKGLDPVRLAEASADPRTFIDSPLQIQLSTETRTMWKKLLEELLAKLRTLKLADAVCKQLCDAAELALGGVTEQAAGQTLIAAFEGVGKQLAESIGSTAIKLDLSGMPQGSQGLTIDQVKQLLADENKRLADAHKATADKLDGNRKLLADQIGAAKDIDDATKKELADDVADLITAELTPDQVKRLADNQLKQAGKIMAAKKLAGMGWAPQGHVHVQMGEPGEIKALQESVDKRLGFEGMPDRRRFERTGKLQDENKKLAVEVLALYDRDNAHRLMAEHKQLAAGSASVSDVAVPAIFERTVIREALYDLVCTQFMDVGTAPFAETVRIPYSYRDTTGASRDSLRKYEGQAIARSGVKQTYDSAYPLPQKLSFLLSDEVRLLTSNGQVDWNALAENVMNAGRIVGEDTERTCFNELVDAADQYATATITTEAVATADGTKTIFALAQFPVLRPKKVYDLKGTQVGSTLHPITVTVNAVAKTEYDGTGTQAAGLYWSLNANLGELTFVDELGVASAPTNTHAIVATYDYSTNVVKFDTDLGSDLTDAHWDGFLYKFGLRKATIEDARYYGVDMGVMSGTLRTMVEQAKQFGANSSRSGTSLQVDGNLGRIKDVPCFKTTAPGLVMGDTRALVGKRGTSRLRVCKPWAMEALENARDSNGLFTAEKEAYGTQWIAVHTPTPLKGAYSSVIVYSATGRVDR